MNDLAALLAAPRIKLVAELAPLAGTRFQPTGFPDLGAATYVHPDGRRLLLVESAQSMANWLEGVLWPVGGGEPAEEVVGLPYLRVERGGAYLTSSRTESHRLASAYVKAARFNGDKGVDLIRERFGLQKGTPIDHARVDAAIFDLDPLSLVHGAFFADKEWHGQPKVARAVTGFIEAEGVSEAYSGGVKFDHVSNTGDKEAQQPPSKEGFGNVPFPRTEFVAERIAATFVIDASQLRRYALEQRQRELLLAIALLEIRGLLDKGLRLRTACDLDVLEVRGERPEGFELGSREELAALVRERIEAEGPRPPLVGVFGE